MYIVEFMGIELLYFFIILFNFCKICSNIPLSFRVFVLYIFSLFNSWSVWLAILSRGKKMNVIYPRFYSSLYQIQLQNITSNVLLRKGPARAEVPSASS